MACQVSAVVFVTLCAIMLAFVFFFKQKTAYEMRISDWSSDVCSSDLLVRTAVEAQLATDRIADQAAHAVESTQRRLVVVQRLHRQIGRASCRERVCQYV